MASMTKAEARKMATKYHNMAEQQRTFIAKKKLDENSVSRSFENMERDLKEYEATAEQYERFGSA